MVDKEISKMTYEEALAELEKIVSELESGSVALDKSIELYTRGSLLKDHCDEKLRLAQEKISLLVKETDQGELTQEAFPQSSNDAS